MSAQLLDMFDHSHPGAFLHDKDMSLKSFETIPRRSPQDHDLWRSGILSLGEWNVETNPIWNVFDASVEMIFLGFLIVVHRRKTSVWQRLVTLTMIFLKAKPKLLLSEAKGMLWMGNVRKTSKLSAIQYDFFYGWDCQQMVNWWFGLVVWDSKDTYQ